MGVPPPNSQVAPLPRDLPFRLISKTIGQGAYASIRKACPLKKPEPVIAIKFINKQHAYQQGRLTEKQVKAEVALHIHLEKHQNIIQCHGSGEDSSWVWIAMELADGGDLFDKIEADEGVGEDIAHFYFTQLIGAVSYMHSKGVAHRDLKPENILLSGHGDLKIADFGLAVLFSKGGQVRLCNTVCGSPPYIAPEILKSKRTKTGYAPTLADIWSCGVVLFVLLVGNTPWDEPTSKSWEFNEYVETNGRTSDELWQKLPSDILSLLRGILKVDTASRFTLDEIRTHPWFTRPNRFLSASGRVANPIDLATQMMESLHVNVDAPVPDSQRRSQSNAMDVDSDIMQQHIAATQPETPIADTPFDWERPSMHSANTGISASQPAVNGSSTHIIPDMELLNRMNEDIALSQFSQAPAVPLSLTQAARKFGDIVPSHSLTRFITATNIATITAYLSDALHRLGIPTSNWAQTEYAYWIRVKTVDGRAQGLNGKIIIEEVGSGFLQVSFERVKGDPLEWRRFFKNTVRYCRDAVLRPQG